MPAHKNRIAGLYFRYFDELVAFLSRRVASRELAADLVQEFFVRLLAREGSVATIRHDRGFLYSSARHLASEARRSPRWRDAAPPGCEILAVAEPIPPPEATLAGRQDIDLLAATIAMLPARCREVFVLHRFEDLSYDEVAARLGISVSSVEKHMMRALGACRAAIDRDGGH